MPQAIAAFLITALGASGFAATLITAVVGLAFTVGISVLTNALFGPKQPKPSDQQQVIRTAVGGRFRDIGIVRSGGQLSFEESANGTLGLVVTLGTGREGEILEHLINGNVVTLDGTGTITQASFHGAIHIYTRSGDDDQTAIGEVTAKFPQWTPNHRQRGCSLAALICDPVKQEWFSEVFNNQQPQYSQTRKGAFLYDPRQDSTAIVGYDLSGAPIMGDGPQRLADESTWTWSDNGALGTADYFAHPDGYGGGYDNVNWTNIAQEADVCDEQVETVTGQMIARWRVWARYGLATEQRSDILTNFLKAIDGFCFPDADGKFNLMVGRWVEPTITITDDHIISMTATLGPDASQLTSAVKTMYTEPAAGYVEQESDLYANLDVDEDPNTDITTLEAYYAPAHNQAMRLGKIACLQLGDRWHVTAILNLYGLNLIGERFTKFASASLGVTAYFKVDDLKLDLANCQVQATLAEVKPSDWDFNASTEEGVPPLTPNTTAPVIVVPVPTGLTLSAVQIAIGAGFGVAIEASWADPGRPDLGFQARYRPLAGGTWVMMAVDPDARTARSGPVDSGTEYEGQVRSVTTGYSLSDWSASATITPTATPTLSPPTALAAIGDAGSATISFSMPNDANLSFVRLYGADSDDFSSASEVGSDITGGPGTTVSETDTGLSAGTRFYWARAFDGSGGSSALAGPASATIS